MSFDAITGRKTIAVTNVEGSMEHVTRPPR